MSLHTQPADARRQAAQSLIIPSPLPDELDRGYFGMVMRVNGVSTEREMDTLLANRAGLSGRGRGEYSRIEILSRAAHIALEDFVRDHTTLPLRRAITSYQPDLEHGCQANARILWYSGMRVTRPGAYFCPECVNEDLQFHGRAYWRRDHQIPGMFWCSKHLTCLCYRDEESAFRSVPSEFVENCHTVPEAWLALQSSPAVESFLTISSALMQRRSPFAVKLVAEVLRQRALAAGFQTYPGKVRAPLLSDAVVAAFGKKWLSAVMPTLANKPAGEVLHPMDGVLFLQTSASSATAYILALAVLFDTPEQALNALIRPEMPQLCRRPRPASPIVDSQTLRSAYIQSRGSYRGVATLLDLPASTVTKRLGKLALPNISGKRGSSLARAALMFLKDGRSLSESAASASIDPEILEELLRVIGTGFMDLLEDIARVDSDGERKNRRLRRLLPREVGTT